VSFLIEQPFRIRFILHDRLSSIQFVPNSAGNAANARGGMLAGRQPDGFVRTFHRTDPARIVGSIEARLRAEDDAVDKILDGEPLTAQDEMALSSLLTFELGSSTQSTTGGLDAVSRWLRDRAS
jgi:hypothetical protein